MILLPLLFATDSHDVFSLLIREKKEHRSRLQREVSERQRAIELLDTEIAVLEQRPESLLHGQILSASVQPSWQRPLLFVVDVLLLLSQARAAWTPPLEAWLSDRAPHGFGSAPVRRCLAEVAEAAGVSERRAAAECGVVMAAVVCAWLLRIIVESVEGLVAQFLFYALVTARVCLVILYVLF